MSVGLWVWWVLIEESVGMVSWFAVGLIEEELVEEGRACILVKEKAEHRERVLVKERVEHQWQEWHWNLPIVAGSMSGNDFPGALPAKSNRELL
ncbi:hypothetical protein SO802_027997 [Lithocarpus litseifolius]|uniref:Uncharacterized protein n=1 Tax=Lithocarpus litseifolius TaxID=425828 RepID=A0AAW2BQ29_9ROSI